MASMIPPKKNTAYVFSVALTSQANQKLLQVNPTLATGDVKVQTDDGTLGNIATLPTGAASSTRVKVSLSAGEMNGDVVWVQFSDAAGAEWCDIGVCLHTGAHLVDDLALEAGANLAAVKTKTDLIPAAGPPDAAHFTNARGDLLANLDAAISTRGTGDATAAGQTSILSAIPSASTVASAVWGAGTRTLTSFGSLIADCWAYVTRTLTSGAAPSAATIADAVWDEAAADHAASGSTGKTLSTMASSGDPLLNPVPGSYASGTAGAALGKVGVGHIVTVGPVAQGGNLTLVRGDDYLADDARALEWIEEGTAWPDLGSGATEATITLGIAGKMFTGSVVTGSGAGKTVRAEPDGAYTANLKRGAWKYQVQARLSSGSVITLVEGTAFVRDDQAPAVSS